MNLDLFTLETSSAVLSDCGLYRYRLGRRWGRGPALLFVLINPSTADAEVPDPTVTRCIGFARREGFAAIDVVNLFGWRATDVRALRNAADPIGPENDMHLRAAAAEAGKVIVGWGAVEKIPRPLRGRPAAVLQILRAVAPVHALAVNADGSPGHPLYLPGASPLQLYTGCP